MDNSYRFTDKTVSYLNYHFIFCPRNRRKIFLIPGMQGRCEEILKQCCIDNGLIINLISFGADYISVELSALPEMSPTWIVTQLKKEMSIVKKEFRELQNMPNIWTRNFFVSTKEISEDAISKYVEEQRK